MELRKIKNEDGVTILLEGKFTFADREKFQEIAFLSSTENVTNITIDCRKLEYIDSTGIGMLLILHESSLKCGIHLKVLNVGGVIKTLFEKSSLGNLFETHYLAEEE